MCNITLRAATVQDAEALSLIYKPYVENTAISFEYAAPDKDEFSRRISHKLDKYPFIVAELDGELVGYAYCSEFLPRPAYIHSVESSVYVKKGMTGKGIGRILCKALEDLLKMQNVLSINACIAVTDTPDETLSNNSMIFHSAMGYRYVGRFNASGYKFGRFYDMIWMEKILTEPKEPFPDFIPFSQIIDIARKYLDEINRGYNKTVN